MNIPGHKLTLEQAPAMGRQARCSCLDWSASGFDDERLRDLWRDHLIEVLFARLGDWSATA